VETSRRVILVVDDHHELREMMADYLEEVGFHCVEAASVAEAKEALSSRPEVLLVDRHLPDGSGHELICWARETQRHAMVALLMTGDGEEVPTQPGLRVLLKPIDLDLLVTELDSALDQLRGRSPVDVASSRVRRA
jgi:DNA-binding response OmpR family regulator